MNEFVKYMTKLIIDLSKKIHNNSQHNFGKCTVGNPLQL
jgi:hypothetical protein